MSVFIVGIGVIFILLIVISLGVYQMQDRLMFHAEKLPINYKFTFNVDFLEINLDTADGNVLNGLLFKALEPKGLVLFYHNHSGNIEHWSRFALFINNIGYDVLLMDYRGFGKSTGKFNEKNFLNDSDLWYQYALDHYDEKLISVYGRGLGATFACYVASLYKPKRLCLESPFFNLNYISKYHYPFLPTKLILKYKFKTSEYIIDVKCKTHIFHGKLNKFIHYKNSVKLYNLLPENIDLNLLPNGNHYNLMNDQGYLNRINQIFTTDLN